MFCGGGERARTDGLLRARQALSQLSYTPNKLVRILKFETIIDPDGPYVKVSIFRLMVGLDGVEPSTSRLSGVRSNQTELQALRIL